jgi:hypothetical protein
VDIPKGRWEVSPLTWTLPLPRSQARVLRVSLGLRNRPNAKPAGCDQEAALRAVPAREGAELMTPSA